MSTCCRRSIALYPLKTTAWSNTKTCHSYHFLSWRSCLSVRPSVCNIDHTRWNSSKVIPRLISLTFLLSADPNITDLLKGNTLSFSRNRSGVEEKCRFLTFKPPYLWRHKTWFKLLLITNRNMYTRFRLVPKSMTLETLKGNNSLCYIMRLPFGAHH